MAHVHPVAQRVDVDRASVHAGHARRIAALDPLVGVPQLEVGSDDVVLAARAGDAAVVGRVHVERHSPGDLAALWGPLRQLQLTPFVVGDDAEVAWDRLLNRWCASLGDEAERGDVDSGALVTVASRDLALIRPLVHHGFAPLVTVAVRPRPDATSAASDGHRPTAAQPVTVRHATAADLDGMVELAVALQHHDASFGMVTAREEAPQALRRSLAAHQQRSSGWSWVVDRPGGGLAGFVLVDPPDEAAWIAPLVTARPTAYLGYLYVRPEARGSGIGAALAAAAHRALDAAGVEATLLHHAVASPQSAPFWARNGYRPLWTTWQRRPAVPR